MPYVDLQSIHNPATGTVPPATWGDQVRDNDEFLIDPPACSVFHNTSQSLADSTLTTMNANSENFDNNAMHSTVTNTSRITIQVTGRYLFITNVTFPAATSGNRLVDFLIDGTTALSGSGMQLTTAAIVNLSYARMIPLSAGQYVETRVRQVSGAAMNVTLVEFAATWLTR